MSRATESTSSAAPSSTGVAGPWGDRFTAYYEEAQKRANLQSAAELQAFELVEADLQFTPLELGDLGAVAAPAAGLGERRLLQGVVI